MSRSALRPYHPDRGSRFAPTLSRYGRGVGRRPACRLDHRAEICYDTATDVPEFLGVMSGKRHHRIRLAPYDGITFEKKRLVSTFTRSVVQGAPTLDEADELPQEDEAQIFEIWGIAYAPAGTPSGKRPVRR